MLLADPISPVPDLDDLSDHLRPLIKLELEPGERLIWAAQPWRLPIPQSPTAARVMGFLTLGLLVAALALLGASTWLGRRADALGSLGLVCFLIVLISGFFFAIGAVFAAIRRLFWRPRRREVYALTDRRAIIWLPMSGSAAVEIRTVPGRSVRPEWLRRLQRPDGSGDLLFLPSHQIPNGFYGLEDVRQVEILIRHHLVATGPAPVEAVESHLDWN